MHLCFILVPILLQLFLLLHDFVDANMFVSSGDTFHKENRSIQQNFAWNAASIKLNRPGDYEKAMIASNSLMASVRPQADGQMYLRMGHAWKYLTREFPDMPLWEKVELARNMVDRPESHVSHVQGEGLLNCHRGHIIQGPTLFLFEAGTLTDGRHRSEPDSSFGHEGEEDLHLAQFLVISERSLEEAQQEAKNLESTIRGLTGTFSLRVTLIFMHFKYQLEYALTREVFVPVADVLPQPHSYKESQRPEVPSSNHASIKAKENVWSLLTLDVGKFQARALKYLRVEIIADRDADKGLVVGCGRLHMQRDY
jgi:hypothetical protein